MSQADEIRKELQKRNEQTRQKIRKEKENQESLFSQISLCSSAQEATMSFLQNQYVQNIFQ